ncbi:glutamate receptor ionotropic, delta-1-like [Scylla paramamosain]|uniref:glutamate receptor ionotropic, delta-1-like n=1 Tax=Scylla paramamosain TaxID=85552 RepID=UPI00308397A5
MRLGVPRASPPCLRMAVLNWIGLLALRGNPKNFTVSGPLLPLLDIMIEKMNVCVDLVVPSDLQYGTQLDNGSWTGIVGQLASKKVDMSGVPVLINTKRNKVVDPGFPVMGDPVSLSYIRPAQRADLAGFVKPFTLQVWSSLLAGLVVVLVGLVVVQVSDARLYEHNISAKESQAGKREALWAALQWTVAAPLAQAWWREPREGQVRLLAGIWLLSSFVLATVYRSNLKAMLILPHFNLPFNSIDEFLQTDIKCFVVESSVVHESIKASTPGTALHRMKKQLIVHTEDQLAVKDFLEGKYAGMAGYYSLLTVVQFSFDKTKTCRYYVADTLFGSLTFSFLFPKGSKLKPKVDYIVSTLKDTGIVDHLLRTNVQEAKECVQSQASITLDTTLRPLALGDFFGVYFLYGAGILTAIFAFLMELCLR